MKFIPRKGAPDIPLALINAQENEELVFFCGAGVSYPAGLPDFAGLVENVFDAIPATPTDSEQAAMGSGFFDRALGQLESRLEEDNATGVNVVRRKIIEELKLGVGADLDTHKALLELSQTRNGHHRLVTTNVDHGFRLADGSCRLDSAPTLPVPKPHKWGSVVHLHGLIDTDHDPNGEHLVFTSGDFGSAYLTERWASKFVTELFVNFTVVFVGYSINDPVLRYMTDAIAAERRQGNQIFKEAYVVAASTPKNTPSSLIEWRAKGVEPVLYSKGTKTHSNLHNSIKAWAAHVRDGLTSKRRIIQSKARYAPIPPYTQDEQVQQVIDTLREKVDAKEGISGDPSSVFAGLNSPPAPVEWLPVLEAEGLLEISEGMETCLIATDNPIYGNLLRPNKISMNLWRWMSHHLDEPSLIRWVLDKGSFLHPDFLSQIRFRLQTIVPSQLKFWKILLSGIVRPKNIHMIDASQVVHDFISNPDDLNRELLFRTLEPVFDLSKAFEWPEDIADEEGVQQKIYDADVAISLEVHQFDNLRERGALETLTPHLVLISSLLKRAMDMWEFVGHADAKSDKSHWEMISIEPHAQNHRHSSWIVLIELCRDLWLQAFDNADTNAISIIEIWRSWNYPVFRRLVLHGFSSREVTTQDEVISYLLEDDGWWLWSVSTHREVFVLLQKFWPILEEGNAAELLAEIVSGPPRRMYRDDLSDDDFAYRQDRERWLILAKLASYGRELFGQGLTLLQGLIEKYPNWNLEPGDRDDFVVWFESKHGNDVDLTEDQLFSLDTDQLISELESQSGFTDGRYDLFRGGVSSHSREVISLLSEMVEAGNWNNKIWSNALTGLAEVEGEHWQVVSQLVLTLPEELIQEIAWSVAWWTRKAIEKNSETGTLQNLWVISKKILSVGGEPDEDAEHTINHAINHPAGIVTEAVLHSLSLLNLQAEEGLPEPEPKHILTSILSGHDESHIQASIILFSRLNYFHAIDRDWVSRYMNPGLDLQHDHAVAHWKGYLWNPRISADLAMDLREEILAAVKRPELFGEEYRNLVGIFVLICLDYSDLYTVTDKKDSFVAMGSNGLVHAAQTLADQITAQDDASDLYWRNRIKPIVERLWPKGGEFLSPGASEHFSLILLRLDEDMEDGLTTLASVLCPNSDSYHVLREALDGGAINRHPRQVLELLSLTFSPEDFWHHDVLREVIDKLEAVDPELVTERSFRDLNDYLLQANH